MKAARGMITVRKRATKRARERVRAATWMVMPIRGKGQLGWWATKRAMATNGDNTGNGYDKDDGGNGPWFVCLFWCVWRDHKK
jgi:hypothetical protein